MTRSSKFYLQRFYPLLDLLLAVLFAYFSSHVTNAIAPLFGWEQGTNFNLLTTTPFLAGAAIMAIPFILRQVGFYHKQNMQRISTALRQLLNFVAYYLCALGIYMSLENYSMFYSQTLLVNFVGIPLVIFIRFLIVRIANQYRSNAVEYRRQIILAGEPDEVEKGWEAMPKYWRKNFNIVRRVSATDTEDTIQQLIEQHSVNGLFVFGDITTQHTFAHVITQCEVQGIDVNLVLRNKLSTSLRVDINEVGDVRMLVLSSTPAFSWSRLFKAILDRIVALLALLCSLPLWVIAAIGIKISDPKGPIFFRQKRSGLYGRVFSMWKFRSMYVDAEDRLEEVKAKYGNEMNGPIFKLTNDPRIFKFGHFIRKTSIDELPQLLNIITGDMSIVGPRPLPIYETEAFPKIEHRRRLSVKPGLTCYWQIEDRSDNADFDNMVAKDLRYIDEWSLWLDVKLFFRTIPAVLFGKGAK